MSDRRDDDVEPAFDDPAHNEIRALLRDARATEPIPAEVAARLDATLAGLTTLPRPTGLAPVLAPVLPLRRRLASRVLAAAAVIAIAGVGAVGLNQVLAGTSGSDDMATADSAGSTAESADADAPVPATSATPTVPKSGPMSGSIKDLSGLALFARNTVPVLTTARFAEQADALNLDRLKALASTETTKEDNSSTNPRPGLAGAAPGSTGSPTPSPVDGTLDAFSGTDALLGSAARTAARSCVGPDLPATRSFPIVLDGAAAVLVVHRATATGQLVEGWSCDGTTLLAAATVPR